MSDLISRSALLEQVKAIYKAVDTSEINVDYDTGFHSATSQIQGLIAYMPTAFDLDKVVQQLEEVGKLQITTHGGRCNGKTLTLGYVKGIENAIEIIKSGGVK